MAFIFAAFASQKQSVRDSLFSASSSSSSPASLSSITQDEEPDSTTEEEAEGETNDEPVALDPPAAESNTNCLHIARYAPPPVNELDVAWPNPGYHAEDIRLYGTWNLRTNYVAVAPCTISYFPDLSGATFGIDWPSAFSNAVSRGVFPQDATLNQGFFTAAWYNVDTDNDGIPDADEIFIHHTDPDNPDTDGDGLADGWEVNHFYNPHSTDSNGDGILDGIAASLNLSATTTDTDGDGLSDAEELNFGTSPTDPDSDGDGMNDGEEKLLQRDPTFDEAQMVDSPEGLGNCYTVSGTAQIVSLEVDPEDEDDFVGVTIDTNDPSGAGLVPATNPEFTVRITGTTFTPLITGEYAFQIESDDEGEMTVGHITATGSYYNGSQEVRGIFKAGVPYPISVSLHNQGGPAQLRSTTFGRLTKVYPEGIVNSFSTSVVVYEDSYENKPGEIVPRKSTFVKSLVRLTAGANGDSFVIDSDNISKLRFICGEEYEEGYVILSPYETRSWVAYYEGEVASDSVNDVVRRIVLRGDNDDGYETFARMTVMNVGLSARARIPDNQNRRIFGVREKVDVVVKPNVECSMIRVGQAALQLTNGISLVMPDYECSDLIELVCLDQSIALRWQCIEPEDKVAVSSRIARDEDWQEIHETPLQNNVCGAGMVVSTRLTPEYVSFAGLYCTEGESDPLNRCGVFTNQTVSIPRHDRRRGAWREFTIGPYNESGDDMVGFSATVSPNAVLSDRNGFEYDIPFAWYDIKGTESENMHWFKKTFKQEMSFDSHKTSRVSKFEEVLYRDISGVCYGGEE